MQVGQRKCQWAGGGMNKGAAFLWLRLPGCLTRRSILEEPHLTIVLLFFSLLLYVYLLNHLSIDAFY